MASFINASLTAGVVTTADTSGVLQLQTAGVTAISIDASQAVSFTNAPTVTGGTANGVAYLNGSKVLTTGSALVFDGTNLGLSVTPSAWFANSRAIDIGAGGAVQGRSNDATTFELATNAYLDSAGAWRYKTTNRAGLLGLSGGTYAFNIAPSGTAGNAITFTQAMTLDASGNLGVGTTSPSSASRVTIERNGGNLRVRNTTTRYRSDYGTNSSGTTEINSYDDTGGVYMPLVLDANPLIFNTNATERARIDSSGNLLVGGTTLANLGTTNRLGAFRVDTANQVYLQLASTSSTSIDHIYCYNSSGLGGRIATSSGTISLVNGSDYRIKNIIGSIQNALETIGRLNPVVYEYKTTLGQYFDGFIAHELQEVIPTAVFGEKDAVDDKDEIKVQGVDLTRLVPIMVKSIQEMKAIIDTQASTITQLQADVAALKGATP